MNDLVNDSTKKEIVEEHYDKFLEIASYLYKKHNPKYQEKKNKNNAKMSNA